MPRSTRDVHHQFDDGTGDLTVVHTDLAAPLVDLDPECELDIVGPAPRAAHVDVVVTNSFGFGGQNVSLVLGRPA